MKIHQLDFDAALASLKSSPQGLTRADAAQRLLEFGANRVATVPTRAGLWSLLKHFVHFFALILWLAAVLAFIAEQYEPGQGMLTLGFAIIGVIAINGLFSFFQEYRAQRTLAALQQLLPHKVQVIRDGTIEETTADQIVPGDVIFLEGGNDVPADCRLIEAFGVRVNTATITGESLPKARHASAESGDDPAQARNVLLAGTSLVAGEARALVFATGMNTEFGRIAHLTQTTGKEVSPLQQEIARLSRWVALLACGLGILFFVIGQSLGLSFWSSLIFAIGIIVANVPEGLLPTVTLALAMGAQRMARRNALIRHLPSVETLGSTTVICTDKTGTLTYNRLAVHATFIEGVVSRAEDSAAWRSPSAVQRRFLEVAAHCHNLRAPGTNGQNHINGDPLEQALSEFATDRRAPNALHERIDEVPFDSDRRRMSTLHATPDGPMLYTKGALEALLPLCSGLLIGDGVEALDDARGKQLIAAEEQFARDGLRVIALAYRAVPSGCAHENYEQELVLLGLAALEDPPRPEVAGAVAQCHAAGIKIVMVTGDHPRTALAVAQRIGLIANAPPRAITGSELAGWSDAQLQLALDAPQLVFARISAEQKRRIVAAFKHKGEIVAVTGDGVNDAPALKEAHIGIAMGLSGTDVAREAADMILLDDNFASIVAAIEEGRTVFDNIRKFLTYILTSNIPEVVPYLAFVLFKIPLPLTIIQILAVDLGTDMLPALALGAEKPDHAVMQRPPRRREQRLVDGALVARAYLFLGMFEALAAMAAFFFVLDAAGWRYGTPLDATDPVYLSATTACLAAIVVMQMVNVWLCRSDRRSIFSAGLFANPFIVMGIATEVALIAFIVYTPWGNALFGTHPIGAEVWLFIVPFALLMLVAEEIRKALARQA